MAPALAAILAPLVKNGLTMIGNAVLAKGKDWVEEKTGVKLLPNLTPEQVVALKQAEMEHEEELLRLQMEARKLDLSELELIAKAAGVEEENVTKRWQADMTSDSWLSKNVRPGVLVYLLTAYLLFSLMSAAGWNVDSTYVTMLGEWGQLVMLAYFGGRTVEKVMEIRRK